jgi:hypothetical protein
MRVRFQDADSYTRGAKLYNALNTQVKKLNFARLVFRVGL